MFDLRLQLGFLRGRRVGDEYILINKKVHMLGVNKKNS